MKKRLKPAIRPVDYHMECCIEARFWKIASTGSNTRDGAEGFLSLPDGRISCQNRIPPVKKGPCRFGNDIETKKALAIAIRNNKSQQRYTHLSERL